MYFFDSVENDMRELNKKMYNGKKENNFTVIFFLAPWCGHCQKLKPVLDNIQSDLGKSRYNGVMAKVYDTEIDKMRYKKNVNAFPTISVFNKSGKYEDYKGSRDEKDLSRFLVSVFEKNKKRFNKIKRIKKMTQKLIGLKKGKSILKRMKKKLKKSRRNPLKNISTIYKNIRNTLKKKKRKKKRGKSKYEITSQMGGRGSKNKKIRCGNLSKKKGYTLKRAERKCLKNKDCKFSSQMAMKGYPKPCHPKKKYWKKQGVTWKTLGVH